MAGLDPAIHQTSVGDRRGVFSARKTRQMDAICAENHELKKRLSEVTERLAVLERIATDPAQRVAREIEELR